MSVSGYTVQDFRTGTLGCCYGHVIKYEALRVICSCCGSVHFPVRVRAFLVPPSCSQPPLTAVVGVFSAGNASEHIVVSVYN